MTLVAGATSFNTPRWESPRVGNLDSVVRLTHFYEKVIKVKADVEAIHLEFCSWPRLLTFDERSSTEGLKGMAQGGEALLRGEPLFLRRGGNHWCAS